MVPCKHIAYINSVFSICVMISSLLVGSRRSRTPLTLAVAGCIMSPYFHFILLVPGSLSLLSLCVIHFSNNACSRSSKVTQGTSILSPVLAFKSKFRGCVVSRLASVAVLSQSPLGASPVFPTHSPVLIPVAIPICPSSLSRLSVSYTSSNNYCSVCLLRVRLVVCTP